MNAPERLPKETIYDDVAEKEGFAAYEDGACETENPYQRGTLCHMCWLDGWERGFEHYAREREMDEQDANELRKYK